MIINFQSRSGYFLQLQNTYLTVIQQMITYIFSNIQKYVRQLNFSKTHSLVNIPNVNQSISCDSLFSKDLTIEFNFIFKIVSIKMKAFKFLTNIAL